MKFDLFVFDMAGTTVDDSGNAVATAVCDAIRAVGLPATEVMVNPVMGIRKPIAIRELLTTLRGTTPTEAEVTAVHADFQSRIINHYETSPLVKEIAGASELFTELRRRGAKVTLDTGFDRKTLDTIVQRLKWQDLLDDTCASDEVANGRPDPEMIHVLMKRSTVKDPARVAKFGDSVSDLEQGFAAGCGLVGAILCDRTRPHMERFPKAVGIKSIAEVLPLLDRQSR
jgi:phosphonatase-like hydrolase